MDAAAQRSLTSALARDLPTRAPARRPRAWVVRRALLVADALGLLLAFALVELTLGTGDGWFEHFGLRGETVLFCLTIPAWIVVAKLYELYDRDEERADHSTTDDLTGVLHLVTMGVWLFFATAWLTGLANPGVYKLIVFWATAIAFVTVLRAGARAVARRSPSYIQNAVIVGAGEVGQLVARKIRQHPEYGIRLVGLVDAAPLELRADLGGVQVLGPSARLPALVRAHEVERVIVAFSGDDHEDTLDLIQQLKSLDVQVDVVPRLYEALGPNDGIHVLEGVPLVGIPTLKRFPFSRTLKRSMDVVGSLALIVLTSPLLVAIALFVKRDSPGPVFFRQERLGLGMRPFSVFKFRTMSVGVDQSVHREFIKQTMSASAEVPENGVYKLERPEITRVGRLLRRTSLDELPNLFNVLRGEMSLVGPRPCLAYEAEEFQPHHFERFRVRPGITGLWQVTARAASTFGEALEMDVAYARSWTLGLDLLLLLKTPFHLKRGTA